MSGSTTRSNAFVASVAADRTDRTAANTPGASRPQRTTAIKSRRLSIMCAPHHLMMVNELCLPGGGGVSAKAGNFPSVRDLSRTQAIQPVRRRGLRHSSNDYTPGTLPAEGASRRSETSAGAGGSVQLVESTGLEVGDVAAGIQGGVE